MNYQIFGIRHHGPGSARSLRAALAEMQPDLILIEGPPEGDALLALCAHAEMQPPVALLVYAPEDPQQAVYYPFASYSPEWQAIKHANQHRIPARFMDLPPAQRMALDAEARSAEKIEKTSGDEQVLEDGQNSANAELQRDPLAWLATAAGYNDSERWWEHMVEERRDSATLFQAIRVAMTALRDELGPETARNPHETRIEVLREAHMRKTLRAALKEGFSNIAVVCGAWHVPALAELPAAKDDNELLKGLPRIKTQATWVPWTYGRLSFASGYGAGVQAPGWYEHLWTAPDQIGTRWLTAVARALRDSGVDVSSAHVIETVRLSETLAALRDRPQPGLPEFNEAVEAVMLFGDSLPMRLIHQRLIVGERLGSVPPTTPMTPLQQDLAAEQKRLRMKPSAADEELILDLRKPLERERSHLLRRLLLLDVAWAQGGERAEGKGTFKERWRIQWQPEFEVKLIEGGRWGNSIAQAASASAMHKASVETALPELAALAQAVMYAELGEALSQVMQRLQAEAAVAADTTHLMQALPPLAQLLRYGDARDTDQELVGAVVEGLAARVAIGLPLACAGLGEEAAEEMFAHIQNVHAALRLLDRPALLDDWKRTLAAMSDQNDLHGILQGHCCRLLRDTGAMDDVETARRFSVALSTANDPARAAAWIDGFLRGSGQILIHDERLWALIDAWVSALPPSAFVSLAPLLRRTFASFTSPERRQMGERAARGPAHAGSAAAAVDDADYRHARAARVLPAITRLLGIDS